MLRSDSNQDDLSARLGKLALVDINIVLPVEIILKIFGMLSLSSLKNAVLVCSTWRQIGEDPTLWAGIQLYIGRGLQALKEGCRMKELPDMLKARRYLKVNSLSLKFLHSDNYHSDFDDYFCSDDTFQAILDHPNIKHLTLGRNYPGDDYYVTPQLLAKVIAKMETVHTPESIGLGRVHLEVIFKKVKDSTNLLYLEVRDDVSGLCPDVLAQGVSRVEEVNLVHAKPSRRQVDAILHAALENNLKTLHISSTVQQFRMENAAASVEIIEHDLSDDDSDDDDADYYDEDADDFYEPFDFDHPDYFHPDYHHFADKYYYGSD